MRVLILFSDTGGGHRSVAEALQGAFKYEAERIAPGVPAEETFAVKSVDIFKEWMGFPHSSFPDWYKVLQTNADLWKLLWRSANSSYFRGFSENFSMFLSGRYIANQISTFDPDVIISVHPMINDFLDKLFASSYYKGLKRPKLAVVVTDFAGAHTIWFSKGADLMVVPSLETEMIALDHGLDPSIVKQLGMPIREAFWRRALEEDARVLEDEKFESSPKRLKSPSPSKKAILGMEEDLPAILILNGGDGLGALDRITEAVEEEIFSKLGARGAQIVLVCGRNEALKKKFEESPRKIPRTVLGFVKNMEEIMRECSCVITKGGSLTFAECMAVGLPIMMSSFMYGQEEGNAVFVVDKKIGSYSAEPKEMAKTVCHWIKNPTILAEMKARMAEFAHTTAAVDTVREVVALVKSDSMEISDVLVKKAEAGADSMPAVEATDSTPILSAGTSYSTFL